MLCELASVAVGSQDAHHTIQLLYSSIPLKVCLTCAQVREVSVLSSVPLGVGPKGHVG